MSERPTPETESHFPSSRHKDDSWVVSCEIGLIRNFERQRDEAREQIAKAAGDDLTERENDAQAELAAWELLKETREVARELRDALKKQQGIILTLINTHPTSLFSRTQNQVNAALAKAKEVLA